MFSQYVVGGVQHIFFIRTGQGLSVRYEISADLLHGIPRNSRILLDHKS